MAILGPAEGQVGQLQHAVLPQVHRAGAQLAPSQPPQLHTALPARRHPAGQKRDTAVAPKPGSGRLTHWGPWLPRPHPTVQGQHHHLVSSKRATSNAWMSTLVCTFARRAAAPPRPTWAVPQATTICNKPVLSTCGPPPTLPGLPQASALLPYASPPERSVAEGVGTLAPRPRRSYRCTPGLPHSKLGPSVGTEKTPTHKQRRARAETRQCFRCT